jgi:hypothetical protein
MEESIKSAKLVSVGTLPFLKKFFKVILFSIAMTD